MVADSHRVRVTYESPPNFLARLGNSCVGILVGLVVVIGGCTLLFWNEGRAVHTYQLLVETRSICHELDDIDHVVESLNGKLVSVSGPLTVPEPVIDPQFGVSKHAAVLMRKVEMYQWVEETRTREFKERDGTIRKETEYSYTNAWKSDLVSSAQFDDLRHTNPREFPVKPETFSAHIVRLGAFLLSQDVLQKITNWRSVVLTTPTQPSDYKLYNNMFYLGDPLKPKVGDVRVSFDYAGSGDVQQDERSGGVLGHFPIKGESFLAVYVERLTMEEVFAKEHAHNSNITWILRAVGWFVLFIGFNVMTRILVILVDWIPLVRDLVSTATSLLCATLSFSLAVLVVGVAWFRYRPLLALVTVGVACVPFIIARMFRCWLLAGRGHMSNMIHKNSSQD
ncbi:hypothetical protein EMCRGX_G004008 [Ephydatia muelleri]